MKSDGFSVEQVQKYLYRINNKTVYVFWEIREKQADTSEFPIIKDTQNRIVTGVPASLSMSIFLATSRGKYTWKQTPGQWF